MADPVELHGATRTYRANFASTNAMCAVEEATGLSFADVLKALRRKRPKVSLLRAFMQCALLDPLNPTPAEAGAILDDLGGLAMIQAALPTPTRTRRPTRG